MRYDVGIKPFTEFWVDCKCNLIYSILTTLDDSNKMYAYINSYSYSILKKQSKGNEPFLNLELNFEQNLFDYIFINKNYLSARSNENYLDQLKDLVKQKKYVLIGVDLFYWIPNSICWNKHHWYHYSFLNGFDDYTKDYFVLDENMKGYSEFIIPESRLNTAMQESTIKHDIKFYDINQNISKPIIGVDDLVKNSENIVKSINEINDDFWLMSEFDYDICYFQDLNAMNLFKIENRHKANYSLFSELHKMGLLNGNTSLELQSICLELIYKWQLSKSQLIKSYYGKNRTEKILKLNRNIRGLLNLEKSMWEKLVSSL